MSNRYFPLVLFHFVPVVQVANDVAKGFVLLAGLVSAAIALLEHQQDQKAMAVGEKKHRQLQPAFSSFGVFQQETHSESSKREVYCAALPGLPC